VLTSLALGTFFFFMGFTFFVTLDFTGCSMCEGYSMESASGWFEPPLDLQKFIFSIKYR
jgi:hypothetical protein